MAHVRVTASRKYAIRFPTMNPWNSRFLRSEGISVCLLDCSAVSMFRYIPKFRKNILLPFSGLKIKVVRSTFTQNYNTEDKHQQHIATPDISNHYCRNPD